MTGLSRRAFLVSLGFAVYLFHFPKQRIGATEMVAGQALSIIKQTFPKSKLGGESYHFSPSIDQKRLICSHFSIAELKQIVAGPSELREVLRARITNDFKSQNITLEQGVYCTETELVINALII